CFINHLRLILIQVIACDCSFLFIYVTFLLPFHQKTGFSLRKTTSYQDLFLVFYAYLILDIPPPMAPMSGAPPPPTFSSGLSATTASVVKNIAATDAAFCSAERVTFVGSTIPASTMFTHSPVAASKPIPCFSPFRRSTTIEPS